MRLVKEILPLVRRPPRAMGDVIYTAELGLVMTVQVSKLSGDRLDS